nr:odorant receptor 1 [Pachyrhinus yasumatsui]
MYHPMKNDAFYYSLRFIQYLHYYPSAEDERSLKWYRFISALIRIFSSFVFIECVVHITNALTNQIPVDISEDVVGLTGLGNSMLLCILFELNVERWSRLFSDITNTTKFGTPKNMTEVVNRANRYSLIYFIYCNVGIVIYGLVKILDTEKCQRLNKEKGLHEICGTVTPLWWPHQEISPLTKTCIIFCQVFSAVYYVPPSAILTFVAWEAAEVIIAKIHHLKELFQNAFSTKDKTLQRERLTFCIRYHQEVIRITENLNKAASRLCGQLSFVAAIILSCIGTQMLKAYSVGAMIHLMGYGVAVFLICQAGQKVRDETYDIQDAVYASNWYEVNPKLAKDTQLIMLRCQKPICLETVPFGFFNYNLLIIIIKTSYSYLTLINKTTEETV